MDISWIHSATEWARNAAIVVGVFVAWRQLDGWKREKLSLKKAEFAEELVATASEVAWRMKSARTFWGHGSSDGAIDDATFDYRRRLDDLDNLTSEFENLRRLRFRNRALQDSDDVAMAIDAIFEARTDLIVALNGKIREVRGEYRMGAEITERELARSQRYDTIIFEGVGDDDDPIRSKIDPALEAIEAAMTPLIRFEVQK